MIHRGSFRSRERSSFPNRRKTCKFEKGRDQYLRGSEYGQSISGSFGYDSILSGTSPKCEYVHEICSAPFITSLGSRADVASMQNSSDTAVKVGFTMVVTGSDYSKGSIFL